MKTSTAGRGLGLLPAVIAVAGVLSTAAGARASGNPDFDAVSWTPLGCEESNLVSHTSPSSFDFAGDANFPAAYFAHDATYLYFRYRMDGDPAGSGGFAQGAWTALMQVPSGNAFQYQYQLSLNGKTDTIEVWHNTVAQDISFSPLFHDDAEVKLFSQGYAFTSGSTVNTTPLARRLLVTDGSHFGGGTDYFLDFAFPVSVLVANGVISSAADIDDAVFFPATSTDPNNYNKGHLNCPFVPVANLTVEKTVTPSAAPANTTTELTYTIAVHNTGAGIAKGIEIDDPALPSYMSNVAVTVSSNDPATTWTVVTTNPLEVKVPSLAAGSTVTVQITADASPTCGDADFTNVATASGVNSMATTGSALLDVGAGSVEVCDGVDNDCDGQVDEGGSALCDDENPCTVDSCNGHAGCAHDAIPGCVPCSSPSDCNDGNACTTETCDGGVCGHTPIDGCTPCSTASDCNDGNACTTETCNGGVCGHTAIDGCVPCSTPSDCNDGNACTTETCNGGVCGHTPIAGCTPCSSPSDCNDGNACTTETCDGGVCGHDPIAGCVPCETAQDCVDGNGCTTDLCNEGACEHQTQAGCLPCHTAADCDDENPCTTDQCGADGSCLISSIPGCQRCTTPADCDDHDECTSESCTGGVCVHEAVADCPRLPENCTDGKDNDGDGLVDCADPDCASAPNCRPHEICGNCIDDDGDGLVDGEDPDCCERVVSMSVRKFMLKAGGATVTGARPRANRLRLKTRYTMTDPRLIDPVTEDTQVQVSDANGQIFCATVPAKYWKHRRTVYRFLDKKGAFASGLRRGRFKIKRNGRIVFKTRGKKMNLRSTDGRDVKITVRVGNVCAEETKQLRPKRKALVFP